MSNYASMSKRKKKKICVSKTLRLHLHSVWDEQPYLLTAVTQIVLFTSYRIGMINVCTNE